MIHDVYFQRGREAYVSCYLTGETFGECITRLGLTADQKHRFCEGWRHEEQFQRRMRHAPVTTDLAGLPEEVRL